MLVSPQHLSIVLTTSAIKSHPSTFIIDSSIQSILSQPSLVHIHVYIICDGAKISPHQQNKYKSGIISQQAMDKYNVFKEIIKLKYAPNKQKFTVIQREFRSGFAENIKYAMQNYAKTQHVMIYQHDYKIQKEIPFGEVVQMMRKYQQQINYITFMNNSYINVIPKMESTPKLRAFLLKLMQKQQSFNFMANIKPFTKEITQHFKDKFGMALLPLNFWYDKLHIASRKFYLDVVFNQNGNYDPNRGKNMKTVTFVEDTFGHCMKWTVDEDPQTLLTQWKAFILWQEKPVFYHQSGRTFITEQTRQGFRMKVQKKQSDTDSDIDLEDFQKMVQHCQVTQQKVQ